MTVRLHRCPWDFYKLDAHPCWKVQKALDERGIPYQVVHGPLRRGKREQVQQLTGQDRYPVIELLDGTGYREDSKAMAEAISSGRWPGEASQT
ncbi:MAG: glutathione S-transferase N-terminal domain-containing protein [Actinomycetota bacterium]|nr:glutathione S-transferase N-terminal domain-containing protein [Actinomycetota bacterium]